MKIGIIGGGSLGLLIASYFAKRHEITVYVKREEHKRAINEHGVKLYKQSVHVSTSNVRALKINELCEQGEQDYFIITVKQPQIKEVIEYLKSDIYTKGFIFLQNGMGHLEVLSQLKKTIYVGVVEHGAHRINDYEVNHLGVGMIKLAPYANVPENSQTIVNELHDASFPIEYYDDWRPLLINKLIINAVINPLTAMFDVPNGSIIDNRHIRNLAKKLTNEAATILNVDEMEAWLNVKRVAANTKHNTSSMRADLNERRKTEIAAITGYLLKNIEGSNFPYTQFVYDAILGLEEERLKE